VAKIKYLGMIVTNQNLINGEIKSQFNSGNSCYHSVQKLLSCLLSVNLKIKLCKTVILPIVLYGCETWLPALTEEHSLRVFWRRMLRRIFEPKGDEIIGG
jgi:hypothetical protein